MMNQRIRCVAFLFVLGLFCESAWAVGYVYHCAPTSNANSIGNLRIQVSSDEDTTIREHRVDGERAFHLGPKKATLTRLPKFKRFELDGPTEDDEIFLPLQMCEGVHTCEIYLRRKIEEVISITPLSCNREPGVF